MKIAFYAPLKPPTAARPSGDRKMARLIQEALGLAGHEVQLAARLRSREADGDPDRQARLADIGAALAKRLIRRYQAAGAWRPEIWFTYHLYYKAPDWIGPAVADALAIPYIVAEASHAPKRDIGPWSRWSREVARTLARADLVIGLADHDRAAVEAMLGPHGRYRHLGPFLAAPPPNSHKTSDKTSHMAARETGRKAAREAAREAARAEIMQKFGLAGDAVWLLAVGMMRADAKRDSYRLLATALTGMETPRRWRLILVGDGPARAAVEQAFADMPGENPIYTGALPQAALADWYVASDIFVWPAVQEAFGMALLEAQAAGLPAVAGDAGGVSGILRDGETGLLCPEGDPAAFCAATVRLIEDDELRHRLALGAGRIIPDAHNIEAAARRLDGFLREVTGDAAEGA